MALAKPFAVITRTRSGSNLLCDYLGQIPGAVYLGEIFKPAARRGISSMLSALALATSELDRMDHLRRHDGAAFWRSVRDACETRGGVPIVKMFYGGAPPEDALWSALAEARIVHLIRENILATVVSRKLANRALSWRGTAGGTYDAGSVTVAPADCEDHLRKLRAHVQWTRARFAQGDYNEIGYDTVCDPEAMSAVAARLSGAAVTLRQKIARQRTRPLCDAVANYDEVAAFDRNFPLLDETFAA